MVANRARAIRIRVPATTARSGRKRERERERNLATVSAVAPIPTGNIITTMNICTPPHIRMANIDVGNRIQLEIAAALAAASFERMLR